MEGTERRRLTPADLLAATLSRTDRVAVTGASGWFGKTALDLLFDAWGAQASERVAGYASLGRDIVLPSGRVVPVRALPELLTDPAPTVLLHFAYLTRDRTAELGVAEFVARNAQISATALEAIRRHRPRVVVTASSGAVYEPDGSLAHDITTNPYGALKVLDELAFARAAEQASAGWAIPRVFSVAGPGMTNPERYALGSMIAMARAGGPIEIRSSHPVFRSYCGVDETIALALSAASHTGGVVFDTGGRVVEMAELAKAVARSVGEGCGLVRPEFSQFAEADRYIGDPAVYTRLARDAALTLADLDQLIDATARTGDMELRLPSSTGHSQISDPA